MKYYAILTAQGASKLANATALGDKLNLSALAVGDGAGALPVPNASQTALVNEVRRKPINSISVDENNSNQIIIEQVIPEKDGGFWIRELGVFDDEGVLIAVANCAETYKPLLQEGSGRTQVVRVVLIVNSTEAVTLKVDPSVVLATRQFVEDACSALEVKMNAALKEHQESRRHPAATTAAAGLVQLSSVVNSVSETQAATPKAVKTAYDLAAGKLGKEANLSDLADVAEALENLGLGDAATRDVGTGAGQIPDMSFFQRGAGWQKLPSGLIIQWLDGYSNVSGTLIANLPIRYPNGLLFGIAGEGSAPAWDANSSTVWGFDSTNSNAIQVAAFVRKVTVGSIFPVAAHGKILTIGY